MIPYIIWAERRVTHTHACGVRDGALVLALEAIDVKQDRQHLSLSSDSGQWTTCIAVHNVVSAKPSAFTTPNGRQLGHVRKRLPAWGSVLMGQCVEHKMLEGRKRRDREVCGGRHTFSAHMRTHVLHAAAVAV